MTDTPYARDPRGGTFIDTGDGRGPIHVDDLALEHAPETPVLQASETTTSKEASDVSQS